MSTKSTPLTYQTKLAFYPIAIDLIVMFPLPRAIVPVKSDGNSRACPGNK